MGEGRGLTWAQLRLEWADGWSVVEEPVFAPKRRAPPRPATRVVASASFGVQIHLFDHRRARIGRSWPKPTVQFAGTKLRSTEKLAVHDTGRVLEEFEDQRPMTRRDCLPGGVNEQRPCPWVSCSHHLAIDVNEAGSLRTNFPGMSLGEMPATCALDIAESEDHPMRADDQPMSADRVGFYTNMVATNVQRLERVYLDKLAHVLADGDEEELDIARKNIRARLTRFVKRPTEP